MLTNHNVDSNVNTPHSLSKLGIIMQPKSQLHQEMDRPLSRLPIPRALACLVPLRPPQTCILQQYSEKRELHVHRPPRLLNPTPSLLRDGFSNLLSLLSLHEEPDGWFLGQCFLFKKRFGVGGDLRTCLKVRKLGGRRQDELRIHVP